MRFSIYRYNPEVDDQPYMQDYELADAEIRDDMMLLEALDKLREQDPTLAFRSSCKEGVCGSDGMNVNGENHLSCITRLSELRDPVVIKPLPGLPVIRDLIIDMELFYDHYRAVDPFLKATRPGQNVDLDHEFLQSPEEREKLDGSYECILCGCCATSCPSFWWNPDKFVGPAGLLQAYRFLADSRDNATQARLAELEDPFSLFRCRGIMNCVAVCPKGLNPTRAIGKIREMLLSNAT